MAIARAGSAKFKEFFISGQLKVIPLFRYSVIPYSAFYRFSCNKQAEPRKTTIDLLCLNREVGHAEARKIIRFIRGKSIVVFHCSACMLLQSTVQTYLAHPPIY